MKRAYITMCDTETLPSSVDPGTRRVRICIYVGVY